ncbi:MAG TPA: HyaD/HybD family hydrogenase maturation endopeptidase [Acidobacteriaceae bacterium]|jgi:hydrogenase maturation protease|nr:HyaD/HybD family hydrogenase maturation endopeptidase [Acidobacteriaceae bacterium]
MNMQSAPRIAVLGLGNLMRADDALGMLAVEAMRADPRLPASVQLIEGGTLGLDLLHPLDGVTHLLALDAIDAGARPGTLLRYAGDALAELPAAKSVHLLGFSDLIGAMRLTGSVPGEIVVLGVQPEKIAWGTELSPTVDGALPRLLQSAFTQIEAWTGPATEAIGGESAKAPAPRRAPRSVSADLKAAAGESAL